MRMKIKNCNTHSRNFILHYTTFHIHSCTHTQVEFFHFLKFANNTVTYTRQFYIFTESPIMQCGHDVHTLPGRLEDVLSAMLLVHNRVDPETHICEMPTLV